MEISFLERDLETAADRNGYGDGHGLGASSSRPGQEPDVKACPDCAEGVLSAARKCRYCGYRFDAVELSWNGHEPKGGASIGSSSVARLGTVSGS
jgi:hypothetical protein